MTLSRVIIPARDWDAIRATLSVWPGGVFGVEVQTSRLLPDGWLGTVDRYGNLTLHRPETAEPDSA